MSPLVLGFVYIHENNALYGATVSFCRAIEQQSGFATEIIDLSKPDGVSQLSKRLREGNISFCFGLQGVGSRLESNGVNLWTQTRLPFLCIHFDNPCYQPLNHYSISPYVANLYQCESFLDVQRRYIGGHQIAGVLPFELPEAHHTPSIPFLERPYKFMFLKSGGKVDEYVDYINGLPPPIRNGVWEALEYTKHNPNLLICDVVDALFTRFGYDRRKQEKDFWAVVQSMDYYIRRRRATDFVNWLKFQKDAVIIGDGWDHIDRTGACAQFLPAQKVETAFTYYERTQFVCNTNPYGQDLIHERIVWGLMMGSCVITDTNAWWDDKFRTVPALIRFVWDRPLDEQLRPIIDNIAQAETASLSGRPAAIRHFLQHRNVARMVAFAEKVRKATETAE